MKSVENQSVEDLKKSYRKIVKKYLLGCKALLGVAFIMPFLAPFDIRPSFESVEVWFQRSGAITSIYALLSTTVADMGQRSLNRLGKTNDPHKREVLDEFAWSFEKVRLAALVLTVVGTVIWGYGDTALKYIFQWWSSFVG